jgi:hypothetical protein
VDVDRAADRITDRPARPGVEDDRDIGEALVDGDIGYVRNPELVGSVNRQLSGSIGIDRLIMIAVGRRDVTAPPAWLKIVLAHQASDLLVIDDHATMPQLGANASPAIEFELLADRRDRLERSPHHHARRSVGRRRSSVRSPSAGILSAMLRPGGRQ